ncbi:MAG: CPBP family intramembrane glutamic endopeptidase [Bacteroidota bacterium]
MGRKLIRILEFVILFFGIPLLIYLDKGFIHPSMIILPVLAFIFIVLRRTTDFQWKELTRWGISRRTMVKNGIIALITLLLMLGYVLIFEREHLFDLPRAHPWIYLAMCLFYPVFSAYGQEVIYRTFLFRRYGKLFGSGWPTILASGITFSFLHIVYYDPVSIILTFTGGIYFAQVYRQTRSVLFTAALHGVMGIILFGVGLGRYFWLDMPV